MVIELISACIYVFLVMLFMRYFLDPKIVVNYILKTGQTVVKTAWNLCNKNSIDKQLKDMMTRIV